MSSEDIHVLSTVKHSVPTGLLVCGGCGTPLTRVECSDNNCDIAPVQQFNCPSCGILERSGVVAVPDAHLSELGIDGMHIDAEGVDTDQLHQIVTDEWNTLVLEQVALTLGTDETHPTQDVETIITKVTDEISRLQSLSETLEIEWDAPTEHVIQVLSEVGFDAALLENELRI